MTELNREYFRYKILDIDTGLTGYLVKNRHTGSLGIYAKWNTDNNMYPSLSEAERDMGTMLRDKRMYHRLENKYKKIRHEKKELNLKIVKLRVHVEVCD